MADLIPIKASELPLDNSLSAGEVILAKGDVLHRVDLARILEDNGGGVPSTGKDGVIQGASEHIEDYTFRFIASLYRINGTLYNTVLNSVITFDPSDPVLDRIDLVVIELVDSIPQIKVVKGTPGNPATKPLLTDIERQIEFTFVTVNAGSTEPANIENIIAYDENLQEAGGEFDTSVVGTGIFLEDTSEPYSGTKAILFEDVSLVNSVTFTSGSTIPTSGYNLLIKIKMISRGSVTGLSVNIGGNSISVTNGNYGYNAFTSGYQHVIIPLSVFSETSFNKIVISARTSSGRGSSDFLMDRVVLQKGVYTPEIDDFTPTGGYTGTAQDIVDFKTDKGGYTGTTQDVVDSVALKQDKLNTYLETGSIATNDATVFIGSPSQNPSEQSGFYYVQNYGGKSFLSFLSDNFAINSLLPGAGSISNSELGLQIDTGQYSFPVEDGTAGQVQVTDGNGNVTWQDVGQGGGGGTAPGLQEVLDESGYAESPDGQTFIQYKMQDGSAGSYNSYFYNEVNNDETEIYQKSGYISIRGFNSDPTAPNGEGIFGVSSGAASISQSDATYTYTTNVEFNEPTINTVLKFPAKTEGGTYILATLDDIQGGSTYDVFNTTTDGLVPKSGASSSGKVLYGDGTWKTPSAGGAVDSVNGKTGVVVLSENEIKGKKLTASVSGTYSINLDVVSDFHLTMTANTDFHFTFTNTPTVDEVRRCKIRLTGEFAPTWAQAGLNVFGDDYDGTKWNDVLVEIWIDGGIKGLLIFQQRENA